MLTDPIDEGLISNAQQLRVVSQMAVGVDNIDLGACTRRGIVVAHTPGVLTETVADTAFGLLVAAARRFREGIDYVRDGNWTDWKPDLLLGHDVNGSKLGIVGMGKVGHAVARRAIAFDMEIFYWSRREKESAQALGARFESLHNLLAASDHILVAVALTDETFHLIGSTEFDLMKESSSLVNISRGPVVDTDALVVALRSGSIASAGLDVTDPEPLPDDHPLLALPNCIVLPHLGSASIQTRTLMAEMAAHNLVNVLNGERIDTLANPDVYENLREEN